MALYAARRLLAAIPLLLATSFIVFSFLHLAPGSPEQVLLAGKNVNEATRQAIRDHYRLDDPFLTQYWTWLTNALQGDLGESIIFRDDVTDVVKPRILPTVELAVYALILIAIFGLGLGIAAGIKRHGPLDTTVSIFTLVGSSISTYVSGILLITIFAVALGWFPVFGLGDSGLDRVYHLTLPRSPSPSRSPRSSRASPAPVWAPRSSRSSSRPRAAAASPSGASSASTECAAR